MGEERGRERKEEIEYGESEREKEQRHRNIELQREGGERRGGKREKRAGER